MVWERALYAFLVEKERRSGSIRTVEGYSRMLQDFFGRVGKAPDKVPPKRCLHILRHTVAKLRRDAGESIKEVPRFPLAGRGKENAVGWRHRLRPQGRVTPVSCSGPL